MTLTTKLMDLLFSYLVLLRLYKQLMYYGFGNYTIQRLLIYEG